MRLPYPRRVSPKFVFFFVVTLFFAELLEGTNVVFVLLVSAYLALFAFAFNLGRGLHHIAGAYVFFSGLLTLGLPVTWKAILGEPAELGLLSPLLTMLCYTGNMAMLCLVAFLVTRTASKRPLLFPMASSDAMWKASIGCFVVGGAFQIIFGSQYVTGGDLGSAIRQFNYFMQMSILLAVTYEVKKSDGKRAVNWVGGIAVLWTFTWGVIYSSKEGMFIGPFCFVLAAAAAGYRFSIRNILVAAAFGWFMIAYMIPYSQYVRQFRSANGDRKVEEQTALVYIFKLGEIRSAYKDEEITGLAAYLDGPHFFGSPQGLMDRFAQVAYDDALINYTEQGHVEGLLPTYDALLNIIPRILWKNKPFFSTGNEYAHEIGGILSEEDEGTAISFNALADAFHQARWFGLLVVWPLVIYLYFLITESLVGGIRDGPWVLLPIMIIAHLGPEGVVGNYIQQSTFGALALLIISVSTRFIFPIAGRLITGSDRTVVRKQKVVRIGIIERPGVHALAAPGDGPSALVP